MQGTRDAGRSRVVLQRALTLTAWQVVLLNLLWLLNGASWRAGHAPFDLWLLLAGLPGTLGFVFLWPDLILHLPTPHLLSSWVVFAGLPSVANAVIWLSLAALWLRIAAKSGARPHDDTRSENGGSDGPARPAQ